MRMSAPHFHLANSTKCRIYSADADLRRVAGVAQTISAAAAPQKNGGGGVTGAVQGSSLGTRLVRPQPITLKTTCSYAVIVPCGLRKG